MNCIGTLRLLEAARHHGPEVFVFGSSSSVYGINEKVPFSEEDEIDKPISPYATTKRTGELLCFNYHHLYGLKTSCLRFFTVYGPAQRPEMAIHKFTDLLARGEPIPLYGDGSSRRDYTFIDDIVDGVVAALDLAPGFEILNLGGAETTALGDLVTWLAQALDRVPSRPAGRRPDHLRGRLEGRETSRVLAPGPHPRGDRAVRRLVSRHPPHAGALTPCRPFSSPEEPVSSVPTSATGSAGRDTGCCAWTI